MHVLFSLCAIDAKTFLCRFSDEVICFVLESFPVSGEPAKVIKVVTWFFDFIQVGSSKDFAEVLMPPIQLIGLPVLLEDSLLVFLFVALLEVHLVSIIFLTFASLKSTVMTMECNIHDSCAWVVPK